MAAGFRRDHDLHLPTETWLTLACIAITVSAGALFLNHAAGTVLEAIADGRERMGLEVAIFAVIASFLIYGNLAYQVARLGYLRRRRAHRPESRRALDERFDRPPVPLAVLVPSYQEEPSVIRQTLISAALQPHPDRRVVLLIDNSPNPQTASEQALLEAARALPTELNELFRRTSVWIQPPPTAGGEADLSSFARRRRARHLAGLYERAAGFLDALAERETVGDHTGALFVAQILHAPAAEHRERAAQLRRLSASRRGPTTPFLRRSARRLATLFDVDISLFERKRYVNLSHEPNKAMNLNSYIGLLGGRWREVDRDDGLYLSPAGPGEGRILEVPDADYVVTLDADSLLLPEYLPRLVSLMEAPGNERVAVAQTPYSAVPGAVSMLEQMAGATTDMQYIVHQGFTHHGATFWVGANALIRKRALDDIVTVEEERGHAVRRYIQDRTVIEDTESSVDLVRRGWTLVNYPERLSFSATPPDFGSLVIQRRRWANGGLIILPKLLRHLAGSALSRRPVLAEGFLRSHYLVSITATNIGLLLLLAYPFRDAVASIWLPLAALPYFLLYTRDLRQAGYRLGDVLRVYALNLLLLPVNLGGVAKSLQQAFTGRKIPFGRTPKVEGRTAAPVLYLVAPLALGLFWAVGSFSDATGGRITHALFAGLNAGLILYAIWRFIGWRAIAEDIRAQISLPSQGRGGGRQPASGAALDT